MKLKGILLLLLLVAVTAGVVLAIVRFRPKTCERTEVRLVYAGTDTVLTESEVLAILRSKGVQLTGESSGHLRRTDVEEALRTNVWFDSLLNLTPFGTTLRMDIRIKSPLLAVYPDNGLPYFIGHEGELLPDNSRLTSNLPVLNGNVRTPYSPGKNVRDLKERALQDAYRIALALNADTLLAPQLTQLYVNSAGEIEAYNCLARHAVLLGHADNLDRKLQQLHIVYDKALIHLPNDMYSQVDVRFNNRVFATRKIVNHNL